MKKSGVWCITANETSGDIYVVAPDAIAAANALYAFVIENRLERGLPPGKPPTISRIVIVSNAAIIAEEVTTA